MFRHLVCLAILRYIDLHFEPQKEGSLENARGKRTGKKRKGGDSKGM